VGRVEEAMEGYGRALEIYRELEDWNCSGRTFHNLALAHVAVHRPGEARSCWLRAADSYAQAGAPAEAARARADADTVGDTPQPPTVLTP
jgi:hypothetical protein